MAQYTVRHSYVVILGEIWWPRGEFCSLQKELSSYDLANMRDENGTITRDSVEHWVLLNSGDFSSIKDFRASIEDGDNTLEFDWEHEESEYQYSDTLSEDY